MGFLDSVTDIIDKMTPGRMEAYASELNDLNFQYKKALEEGRNSDASEIRKRMVVLRRKLGMATEE